MLFIVESLFIWCCSFQVVRAKERIDIELKQESDATKTEDPNRPGET